MRHSSFRYWILFCPNAKNCAEAGGAEQSGQQEGGCEK